MEVIHATNVNTAYVMGMWTLQQHGTVMRSRAGAVLRFPWPVTTHYYQPVQKVLMDPVRDANPFFHVMESLWMLSGRNDVKWILEFNSKFDQFSDDGETFNGAYGYRWRQWFRCDQLDFIIKQLKEDKTDRRVVLGMWDPESDLGSSSKDVPCNLNVKFDVRHNKLNMYVMNRSNDIIWGAYGANAVHMSFLQEYVAAMVGIQVGEQWQVSLDWHAYLPIFNAKMHEGLMNGLQNPAAHDPYKIPEFSNSLVSLVDNVEEFHDDLELFMKDSEVESGYGNSFFQQVAVPMRASWRLWKQKKREEAMQTAAVIGASDWRHACIAWMERRMT